MTAKIHHLPRAVRGRTAARDAGTDRRVVNYDLRRARVRIAQLEACLAKVMRDNLVNFNRARDAERRLLERTD